MIVSPEKRPNSLVYQEIIDDIYPDANHGAAIFTFIWAMFIHVRGISTACFQEIPACSSILGVRYDAWNICEAMTTPVASSWLISHGTGASEMDGSTRGYTGNISGQWEDIDWQSCIIFIVIGIYMIYIYIGMIINEDQWSQLRLLSLLSQRWVFGR